MTDGYVQVFSELSPILLEFGWLFPPKALGGVVRELRGVCSTLAAVDASGADRRRKTEQQLGELLVFAAFHPKYRAYYVWLAKQQPFVQGFSHLLETAAFHYFARDYLSTVHCLLPAVEGTIRAHHAAHNANHAGRLTYGALSAFLRGERPVHSYPEWHSMYRTALADFLDRWLWHPTPDADFSLSYLNRHYALHGLGQQSYYRALDCHRLFLFLDLYMELLVLETRVGENPFIPAREPGIERRRTEYERLMVVSGVSRFLGRKRSLLVEHPCFHEEPPGESNLHRFVRWTKMMHRDRRPG